MTFPIAKFLKGTQKLKLTQRSTFNKPEFEIFQLLLLISDVQLQHKTSFKTLQLIEISISLLFVRDLLSFLRTLKPINVYTLTSWFSRTVQIKVPVGVQDLKLSSHLGFTTFSHDIQRLSTELSQNVDCEWNTVKQLYFLIGQGLT